MIRGLESILIGSENPRKLAEFHRDKVGLKLTMEFEMGDNEEEAFSFEEMDGANLFITHHSEVTGKNKTPERIMFNLEVLPIEETVEKLKKAKVKMIQDIYHIEGYGKIATFEDPDGNYFQVVQIREEARTVN